MRASQNREVFCAKNIMPNKVESLYKHLTGKDPRDYEPPLNGVQLQKECQREKNGRSQVNFPPEIKDVSVYESGNQGNDGPFTILQAVMTDGSIMGTYLFSAPPKPKDLLNIAMGINREEWFSLNLENPSLSGI